MIFNVKILNPVNMPDWDEKISSFKEHCFFHSKGWAEVLENTYHYHPCYFTFWQKDELCAVIPMFEISSTIFGKRGATLPFTDHCLPLVKDRKNFNRFFYNVIETGRVRKWRRVDFRGGQKYFPRASKTAVYNLHLLKLMPNEKALLKTFRSSTQRNIEKARREGLTIDISTDITAVKEFYRLNCMTRRHHGIPPQPFTFFRSIQKHVLSKDHGMIVLARQNGKPIAGGLFFHFGRKAMYKYGASQRDCLGTRPNNLVMWEAIKWYCKNGFSEFDMGRSEPDNSGLNQFKNGWRAAVETLYYYTFNIPQMKFCVQEKKVAATTVRSFQKIPLPVLRIVGRLAYRYMG